MIVSEVVEKSLNQSFTEIEARELIKLDHFLGLVFGFVVLDRDLVN